MRLIWLYICRNDEHNKGFFPQRKLHATIKSRSADRLNIHVKVEKASAQHREQASSPCRLLPGGEKVRQRVEWRGKNKPRRPVVTISGWPCGAGRDPFPWRAANGLRHRRAQPSDNRPAGPIFRDILPASCCDAS